MPKTLPYRKIHIFGMDTSFARFYTFFVIHATLQLSFAIFIDPESIVFDKFNFKELYI